MTRQLTHNPWSSPLFTDVRSEMNRLFEGLFDNEEGEKAHFAPRGDFVESDKSYEVSLDLPGMKPEDVEIEFKDGNLWVTGERKHEHEEKDKSFHRVERSYGKFRRIVSLGNDVDADNINASYKHGVLSITLPKVEEVRPKRIEVKE